MTVRQGFYVVSLIVSAIIGTLAYFWPWCIHFFWLAGPLILLGCYDVMQRRRNVLRNYPVLGHFRYMLEGIRPQIQQYFIERNTEEVPFSREQWELIQERSTNSVDELPFGTQRDVHALGYEWINHSLAPKAVINEEFKVMVGGSECKKPYLASRLNVSAMSFGALSKNAVRALNRGARLGGFAQNTGEGGLTKYHLKEGGDVFWQIGTGYFGCRSNDGHFDEDKFQEKAILDNVKMVEIKLSQGAKPAHGGILPAAKISKEISEIRGVPMGEDCISPPAHTAFSTPKGLLDFVAKLRDLSGGKPIGFKLCLGIRREFLGICKAMIETGITPDFITVDGSEGGTGAAPLEFTDFIGTPLDEGLVFVHNALVGAGVRDEIKIIASGKIVTGFDVVCKLALGADMCNAAREMMFSIGCIQSRKCHTNKCPTGVATQDPKRYYALDPKSKAPQVRNYHHATLRNYRAILGAAGVSHPDELRRSRIRRQVSQTQALRYSDIYPELELGCLRDNMNIPEPYSIYWEQASADSFDFNEAAGKCQG
tara:strand:- start:11150 stop:12766 length:1617 start_codon:yes stop_codon:yes gene_type:complete